MSYIASMVMEKGIDNMKLDMLDPASRKRMLGDAAEFLIKEKRFDEAAKALMMAEDFGKLKEIGLEYMGQKQYSIAAVFLVHTKEEPLLWELSGFCLNNGFYNSAAEIFKSLGREDCRAFVEQNFLG